MKIKIILFIITSVLFNSQITNAQCFDLIKSKGFQVLDTTVFIPQGRFDAMELSEGDYLNVYKSFFRGKTYKVVVVCDENMPVLNFQIKTMQGEIIFNNIENDNIDNWEYTSDKNQNLMVYIEIPPSVNVKPESGCIAVILGYKM